MFHFSRTLNKKDCSCCSLHRSNSMTHRKVILRWSIAITTEYVPLVIIFVHHHIKELATSRQVLTSME